MHFRPSNKLKLENQRTKEPVAELSVTDMVPSKDELSSVACKHQSTTEADGGAKVRHLVDL